MTKRAPLTSANTLTIDVSIILPCLNEARCLPHCIANARQALDLLHARCGLVGEIIVSDNGSDDGGQLIALALGAIVTNCETRGYGAALIQGMRAANGRYLIMGDCDGSYDFREAVELVELLRQGADLAMGSRFKGRIEPGAMPWKNRYLGNPVLTGVLNVFFRSGVTDAHCGLRALTKDCFERLRLSGAGMEFASEMIVKAALKGERIAEAPVTLSRDIRDRPPHLRPWRDGWRHLRYLFMLSPTWIFGAPALLAILAALIIFATAGLAHLGLLGAFNPFGASWTILGGFLFSTGHFAAVMALAAHFYGVRQGYRRLRRPFARFRHVLTLENLLVLGSAMMLASLAAFIAIGWSWSAHDFAAPSSVLPVTLAAVCGATGLQTALAGFVLAIIGGHDAELAPAPRQDAESPLGALSMADRAA